MGHTRRIPRILPANRADTRARSSGRRRRGRGVFGSTSAGRGWVRGVATGSGGGGRGRRAGRYGRGHRRGGGMRSVGAPAVAGGVATPFRAIPREDASLRRAWARFPCRQVSGYGNRLLLVSRRIDRDSRAIGGVLHDPPDPRCAEQETVEPVQHAAVSG